MPRTVPGLSVRVPVGIQGSAFNVTQSGTFSQGDITIGRNGLTVDGDVRPPSRDAQGAAPLFSASLPVPLHAADCATPVVGPEGTPAGGSRCTTADNNARFLCSRGSLGSAANAFTIAVDELVTLRRIGKGCSGVVHLCMHRPSGDVLVRKDIPFNVADEAQRKQLCTELRTTWQANSPCCVHCFEAFFHESTVTIIMEYMNGGSIDRLFRQHPDGLPEPMLAAIACQVLEGLQHLHCERRVIHRDIKPSNLLVNTAGEVKIADFGVSGELDANASRMESFVGTLHYLSPERIESSKYSFNADVWSLGVLLLEGALGRFPYLPDDAAPAAPNVPGASKGGVPQGNVLGYWDLLHAIVEQPAPRPDRSRFTQQFCDFVEACLTKDAAARPSAEDLLRHPWLEQTARGGDATEALRGHVQRIPVELSPELAKLGTEQVALLAAQLRDLASPGSARDA
ncbi:unnamed protein product [Pedinophyceae sp. YPF-701]|nr:unnamed protein product [Pedinophyceae sp. YPF-701]